MVLEHVAHAGGYLTIVLGVSILDRQFSALRDDDQ